MRRSVDLRRGFRSRFDILGLGSRPSRGFRIYRDKYQTLSVFVARGLTDATRPLRGPSRHSYIASIRIAYRRILYLNYVVTLARPTRADIYRLTRILA